MDSQVATFSGTLLGRFIEVIGAVQGDVIVLKWYGPQL